MNNLFLRNPLSESSAVTKVAVFDVNTIVEAYANMGLDVTRFFYELDEVKLYECRKTGYRFYFPFTTIGDADFYKELSLKRENYYSTRWEHLKILPTLDIHETVLEIGSGFGVFLSLLKSKGISAEGIELNPEALNVCKEKDLNIHNELIETFALKNLDKYDVVCYFQVLEHITSVHDFVKNSLLALKPNGKLIIGVPNNNPYLFVNDKYHTLNLPPHHAGLWNKKSLKSLEQIFNVKLVSLEYEPLEKTYNQFLKTYIKNSNLFYSRFIKALNRVFPKILKRVLCKYIDGRNILVVFKKLS